MAKIIEIICIKSCKIFFNGLYEKCSNIGKIYHCSELDYIYPDNKLNIVKDSIYINNGQWASSRFAPNLGYRYAGIVDKDCFLTLSEYRDKQIDSILND